MRQSGRTHWMVIVSVLLLAAILVLVFFSGETPTVTANKFLGALIQRDAKTLAELSYAPGEDRESVQKKWDFTVNEANPNYRFAYNVKFFKEITDEQAVVTIQMVRDVFSPAAYEENFQIPLVKDEGRWKVDIYGLSRKMYPSLPRAD